MSDDRPTRPWRSGPKPRPSAELRTVDIRCRMTEAEAEQVRAAAEASGLRLADYTREVLLRGGPKVIPEINRQAWAEFARTASNLNQTMHAINSGQMTADVDDLARQVADVRETLDRVRLMLIGGG